MNLPTERDAEKRGFKGFVKKYFLEGQHLDDRVQPIVLHEKASNWDKFYAKHRKHFSYLIPMFVMHCLWWTTAIRYDFLSLYTTRWHMPLTMIVGATLAGMTSEGGGAVAFPVMTLILKIDPETARDFSLMIQSIGMTCALFGILFMQVQIEKKAVLFVTLGSVPGMMLGLNWLNAYLTPSVKKMLFVSIWSSFAVALYNLNSKHDRKTYKVIPKFKSWKAAVLVCTGFIGGIFTSFAGSGIDICTFSMLTLLFRVTEKTVTPTTVILMGLNSLIGFFWRAVWMAEISPLAYEYLAVSAPLAFTLAPFGSFLGTHFHRLVMATFIYAIEISSVVVFLFSKPPLALLMIGTAILSFGFLFFSSISRIGERMMCQIENAKKEGLKPTEVKLLVDDELLGAPPKTEIFTDP